MTRYVTTDGDMWNSADESHFVVLKGQARPLPEITTEIIEDALDQGLLREATEEEVNAYLLEKSVEEAVRERKIRSGETYEQTLANYKSFIEQQDAIKEKPEEKVPEPVAEPKVEEAKIVEQKVEPDTEKKEAIIAKTQPQEEKPQEVKKVIGRPFQKKTDE
jgi:hypothetical protein